MTGKQRNNPDPPAVDGQPADRAGLDISMDLDDPALDAAIEEALAATEARARSASHAKKRAAAQALPDFDLSDLGDDPERSMHFLVDEIDEEEQADGEFDFMSLDSLPASRKPATGVDEAEIKSLAMELEEALADEEEADEDDLQAEMEKLLAESFGVGAPSDDDPDLAFPSFDDDDDAILAEDQSVGAPDHEELFAASDDGTGAVPVDLRLELDTMRAQVVELSRALSLRDLELRTAEERVEGMEAQLVSAARQLAALSREFDSSRRRAERDKEELRQFAGEKALKEFLGVFDNLERALDHAGDERNGPFGQGVGMTRGQFLSALKRCGAERIDGSPGTEFDPTFHEAVGQEFSDDIEAGRILYEMQAGFTLHTRLLRASMVSVSRGPAAPAAPVEAPKADEPEADELKADKPKADEVKADKPTADKPATSKRKKANAKGRAAASARPTGKKRKRASKKKATPGPSPAAANDPGSADAPAEGEASDE